MFLKYLMIPVIKKKVYEFAEVVWDTQRIRAQKDKIQYSRS